MSLDHAPHLLERPRVADDPTSAVQRPAAIPAVIPAVVADAVPAAIGSAWFDEPGTRDRVAEFFGRAAFLVGMCIATAVVVIVGWTVIIASAVPFVAPTVPADPATTFLATTYGSTDGSGPVIVGDGVVVCTADLSSDRVAVTGRLRCDWSGFADDFPGTLDYTFAQSAHIGYTLAEGEYVVVATTPDGERLESRSGITAS